MSPRASSQSRRGFALPSVLVLTGVVSVVFLVAVTALDVLGGQARDVVDGVTFREQVLTLEARFAYLSATGRLTSTSLVPQLGRGSGEVGVDAIALDGSYYRVAGARTLVSVQDEAGLINLDSLGREAMPRLFAALGADPARQTVLADRLADYIDPDDLKRPDGAEMDDYARAGLPLPPNQPLRHVAQVLGLLGWRENVVPSAWAAVRDSLTADPSTAVVNVNTAPALVLKVLYGFSDAQAEAAIRARRKDSFGSLESLGHAADVPLVGDTERVYSFPNGRFALQIVDPVTRQVARARLELTPDDADRPLWLAEESISLSPQAAQIPPNAPFLPKPTA